MLREDDLWMHVMDDIRTGEIEMSATRVRLDYERKGWHEDFYTLLPLDVNGDLAELDTKMERLRKQHIAAVLYILDEKDQIDKEEGYQGIVGGVEKPDGGNAGLQRWHIWREDGLV